VHFDEWRILKTDEWLSRESLPRKAFHLRSAWNNRKLNKILSPKINEIETVKKYFVE